MLDLNKLNGFAPDSDVFLGSPGGKSPQSGYGVVIVIVTAMKVASKSPFFMTRSAENIIAMR